MRRRQFGCYPRSPFEKFSLSSKLVRSAILPNQALTKSKYQSEIIWVGKLTYVYKQKCTCSFFPYLTAKIQILRSYKLGDPFEAFYLFTFLFTVNVEYYILALVLYIHESILINLMNKTEFVSCK